MKTSVIVSGVAGLILVAGQARGEDLMDVYRLALQNDPQLRQASAVVRSTRENKTQAFSNFLPNLSGNATYSDSSGDFELVNGQVGSFDSQRENIGLTLNQSIYDQRNYTRMDAARSQISQSDADYQSALNSLLTRVAESYFGVLTAEDALKFAQAEETANERQLEQAEQRYEVGLTAITDVHEARASYDRARANTIIAANRLDDAREALRELTAQDITTLRSLAEEYPLVQPEPNDPEAWVATALENNPQIQSRKFAADAAYHNVRTQRAGHLPTVGAQLSYSDTTNDGDLGPFSTETQDSTTFAIQLTVPLYEGGSVSSRTRQAVADYDAALERLEQDRRAVIRSTRNNFRAVIAGISEVEAFKQTVVSAQSALEATEAGFEVGTRTIVDVLISQRTLFQAQQDYSRARHDLILDHLRLRASAGTIEVDNLERVNSVLE
ncbi:MAG: TolC family outer membrane protein [Xanthomonadales bacterium]|nr:TolC family outer membrane protein [Xanthomonadales bacterium]